MFKDIKGAIFDMDGTLIDSMWIWGKVDIDYLAKRNMEMPSDLRENIEHLCFEDTARYFKNRFALEDSIEKIMGEWTDMALHEYAHNVELKAGAREFLEKLKEAGIKIALATSNSHTLLELALKRTGIFHYFDVICTTSEVDKGKNHPDIYLLAAKKLGVTPENCAVFEDILPAITGAKAAGMKVFGVYDDHSKLQKENIIKLADYYITHYEELTKVV